MGCVNVKLEFVVAGTIKSELLSDYHVIRHQQNEKGSVSKHIFSLPTTIGWISIHFLSGRQVTYWFDFYLII